MDKIEAIGAAIHQSEMQKRRAEYATNMAERILSLEAELAAAQATIAQIREALDWAMGFADSAISDGLRELGGESISDETHRESKRYWESETKIFDGHKHLRAAPTNLDALHEARARALEEAVASWPYKAGGHREEVEAKAAAHRARKEGK